MVEKPRWIREVSEQTGLDEERSVVALRVVLQAIRDELTPEQNERLAAQMSPAIRDLYFAGWDRERPPQAVGDEERFLQRIREQLPDLEPAADTAKLVRGILRTVERHMGGLAEKIKHAMPKELRELWPSTIAEETLERHEELVAEERAAINEALHAEWGHERGAPLAPHQNRTPGEEHRGGPLPNQKR